MQASSYECHETFSGGKTISHRELHTRLGFGPSAGNSKPAKDWIVENGVPYAAVNSTWFVCTADVREALRRAAKTHNEHTGGSDYASGNNPGDWPSRKREGR